MDRRFFIREQMLGLAGCLGLCQLACTKEKMDIPSRPDKLDIDLRTNLLLPGDFMAVATAGVLVIRLRDGNTAESFVVLQRACPHAGGDLFWSKPDNQVVCPVHGSRFGADGSLLTGPAAVPLKRYRCEVQDGNLLTIWLS